MTNNEIIKEYEGLTPEQQLNLFRNKYYTDGSATEQGIIANAINEILPLYYCQLEHINSLNFDVETYRLRWAKATAKLDVEEVKHGRWEPIGGTRNSPKWSRNHVACSVCKREGYTRYAFCPNCGANMDGGKKND